MGHTSPVSRVRGDFFLLSVRLRDKRGVDSRAFSLSATTLPPKCRGINQPRIPNSTQCTTALLHRHNAPASPASSVGEYLGGPGGFFVSFRKTNDSLYTYIKKHSRLLCLFIRYVICRRLFPPDTHNPTSQLGQAVQCVWRRARSLARLLSLAAPPCCMQVSEQEADGVCAGRVGMPGDHPNTRTFSRDLWT